MLTQRNYRRSSYSAIVSIFASCFVTNQSTTSGYLLTPQRHFSLRTRVKMDHREEGLVSSSSKRAREFSCTSLVCPPLRRARRLFRLSCLSTDSTSEDRPREETKVKEAKPTAEIKKPKRPLNSYLKVVLDNDTIDRLHDIAVKLQSEVPKHAAATRTADETETTKPPAKKQFRFRARSRPSLHMTFFFGGETLCALPPLELMNWHRLVAERLEKSHFVLNAPSEKNDPVEEPTRETLEEDKYWFRLKGLSLFPPRRNYLIVALLEASPAWEALHDDIRAIAADGGSESLRSVTQRSKERWTPHITMGNLYGGRKADLKTLAAMLQDFPLHDHVPEEEAPTSTESSQGAKVDGLLLHATKIAMGGPVPTQVELDWDFHWQTKCTPMADEEPDDGELAQKDTDKSL